MMLRSNRAAVEAELTRLLTQRNEAAATVVESVAKDIAPVDSGRLRSSITHDSDESGFIVGTNVEYAPFVELGTVNQAPQSFLVSGVRRATPQLRAIYGGK